MGVLKKSDNLIQPFHQLILYMILYIRKEIESLPQTVDRRYFKLRILVDQTMQV